METELQYFMPIIANTMRYFLIAGIPFLIFYIFFPEKFSKSKIQSRFAQHKDFIREILYSLQTSVILGVIAMIVLFSPFREYTQLYENLADHSLWWIPVSVFLALVVHDTYFYWMHRTVHHPKLFKTIHLVHHKSVNPSPWASYSFHFFESILEGLIAPIVLLLIPMHPTALVLFALSSFFINVYGHLGFEVAPRWFRHSFLFEIVNTSVHHNLHHEKFKGNYGLYLRFWDRLMGTENPNYVSEYDRIQESRFGTSQTQTATSFWRKISLPFFVVLLLIGISVFGQSPIEGKWKDAEDGGVILIYEENGTYFGQLISADKPEENKRIQEHGEKIVLLKNFEKKNEKELCCGTIYQPKEKRLVQGTLVLLNSTTLKVKGRYGIFTGSRIWRKI